jgi:Icc protein
MSIQTKRFTRREVLSVLVSTGLIVSACENKEVKPSEIRFAIASDGHYGEPNTDYKRFYQELIDSLKAQHNEKLLDFVVINGDLVHGTRVDLLPEVKSYLDQLPMPYYVTRGNHDRVSLDYWTSMWGYSTNHILYVGDTAIVLFDTSNESGAYYCGNNQWLESELAKIPAQTPVFLFMHIPFLRSLSGENECQDTADLITKYPQIKGVFHGHDHSLDIGVKVSDKAVFFDGHLGSSWGVNYRGYRVVESTADSKYLSWQYNLEENRRVNSMVFG